MLIARYNQSEVGYSWIICFSLRWMCRFCLYRLLSLDRVSITQMVSLSVFSHWYLGFSGYSLILNFSCIFWLLLECRSWNICFGEWWHICVFSVQYIDLSSIAVVYILDPNHVGSLLDKVRHSRTHSLARWCKYDSIDDHLAIDAESYIGS